MVHESLHKYKLLLVRLQGPVAEFNIQTDPEAAKIVFESGVDLTMMPLEVCQQGGNVVSSCSGSVVDCGMGLHCRQ